MTRALFVLALVLAPLPAKAIEVTEVTSPIVADLVYTETPPAEADWLVFVVKDPKEARGPVLWRFADEDDGLSCTATRIFRAKTRASAQVKIAFVKAKGHARCKRKCSLVYQP